MLFAAYILPGLLSIFFATLATRKGKTLTETDHMGLDMIWFYNIIMSCIPALNVILAIVWFAIWVSSIE
jgi:hypothetical protein